MQDCCREKDQASDIDQLLLVTETEVCANAKNIRGLLATRTAVLVQVIKVQHEQFLIRQLPTERILVLVP